MIDNKEWHNVADLLLPVDFYRPEHQLIFKAMLQRGEVSSPIDVVTLKESLDNLNQLESAGGIDYLAELVGNARGTANMATYTEIIRERAILRRLISVAHGIADSGYNPAGKKTDVILDKAEEQVFKVNDERALGAGPMHITPLVNAAVDRIDELAGLDGELTGLTSGFKDLDKLTLGWQKSDLIIVAGRPSMGKTAFAMNLVESSIMHSDDAVVVFSLEMPAESLIFRMLSSMGKIDQTRLRTGNLTEADWPGFNSAVKKLKDRPLYIDESAGITPMEMRARLRRIESKLKHEKTKLGLVVVDYLQLMQLKNTKENRVGEISEISRSLKLLARDFKCPVVALSQLNRGLEQRPNKRPVMSDLRESGAIEQDADVITFIYRDEVYNEDSPDKGVAEIIIGKQRNGPIGTVRLSFLGQFTRFESHAQPRYDDSYTHG
jgi:replicative DNA helicase